MSEHGFWRAEDFVEDKLNTPKSIIQDQFDILNEITDKKIIGRVTEYEGDYTDRYEYKNSSMFNISPITIERMADNMVPVKTFDVQKVLGENEKFVYEFYITSKGTSKYKYRIGFIYYDILLYPVYMVLEKSLADELGIPVEITSKDEEEFIKYLSMIFSSERITCVIKNLLSMNSLPPYKN